MADDYLLKKPTDQLFYRVIALLSSIYGVADPRWWGYKLNKMQTIIARFLAKFYTTAGPLTICVQVLYFYTHRKELPFNIKGILFAMIPANVYMSACMVSSQQKSYEKAMKDFMGKIHLYNYLGENEFIGKKLIEMEKKTRRASYFMVGFLMLDWVAWSVCTAFNSVHNRELTEINGTVPFETILYYMLPVNYEYNFKSWAIVHSCNIVLLWGGCVIILVHQSTNYAFVFQLIGHIEIMKHNLETKFVGILTQDQVRERLIDIIKHHSFILQIHDDIQAAFGFNVVVCYAYNLIADSLLLYLVMFGEKKSMVIYTLMLIVYMGALIVISFVLEEIKIQSDGLSDLIYNLNWIEWSVPNQKMLLLLLMRAQPEMIFIAAGGLRAGVQPMISIIKSTFSYYVMLKQSMNT